MDRLAFERERERGRGRGGGGEGIFGSKKHSLPCYSLRSLGTCLWLRRPSPPVGNVGRNSLCIRVRYGMEYTYRLEGMRQCSGKSREEEEHHGSLHDGDRSQRR